jgi:hypothetical protein
MAISQSFQVSQNSATPNIITVIDTSTGVDTAVTSRKIYLLQSNGTYLVPSGTTTNYIVWPITNTTTRAPLTDALNVLTEDTALSIRVDWLSTTGTVLYTAANTYAFTAYNETFYYGLTESQVANPNLSASTNWYQTKLNLRVEIDSAVQAIAFASDIVSSQEALNRATYISTNQAYFF